MPTQRKQKWGKERRFVRADGAWWSVTISVDSSTVRFAGALPGEELFEKQKPRPSWEALDALIAERAREGFVLEDTTPNDAVSIAQADDQGINEVLRGWRSVASASWPPEVHAALVVDALLGSCVRGGLEAFLEDSDAWAVESVGAAMTALGLPDLAALWTKATQGMPLASFRGSSAPIPFADRGAAKKLQQRVAVGARGVFVDDIVKAFVRSHAARFVNPLLAGKGGPPRLSSENPA